MAILAGALSRTDQRRRSPASARYLAHRIAGMVGKAHTGNGITRTGKEPPAAKLLAASKQETEMSRTLYIRHVPDDVAERLERLASRA